MSISTERMEQLVQTLKDSLSAGVGTPQMEEVREFLLAELEPQTTLERWSALSALVVTVMVMDERYRSTILTQVRAGLQRLAMLEAALGAEGEGQVH